MRLFKADLKELSWKEKLVGVFLLCAVGFSSFTVGRTAKSYVLNNWIHKYSFSQYEYSRLTRDTIIMGGKVIFGGQSYRFISLPGISMRGKTGSIIGTSGAAFGVGEQNILILANSIGSQGKQVKTQLILIDENRDGDPDVQKEFTAFNHGKGWVLKDARILENVNDRGEEAWNVWVVRFVDVLFSDNLGVLQRP